MAGMPVIERHLTTAELARLLSVHPETIRRAAASGRLPSVRIGRIVAIPRVGFATGLGR